MMGRKSDAEVAPVSVEGCRRGGRGWSVVGRCRDEMLLSLPVRCVDVGEEEEGGEEERKREVRWVDREFCQEDKSWR